VTDALGRTTTYERDLLGRPTRITHPDGTTTTLHYDQGAVGYLSSVTDPSGTTSYERDSLGRTTRKTQTLSNGNTRSIAYQYDASGQLAATTYPGGQALQYQRDTTGQITALVWAGQPIVQNITWTPLGQPQSWQWTLPGAAIGLPGSRSYNSAGQTTATETTSQQYDGAGRILSLTQHLWHPADTDSSHSTLAQSPTTWSASYDRAGRLSALTKTSGSGHAKDSTTYQYDPNGNLTSSQRERAATTTTRSYRTESGHNKLLGFSQTSTSASGTASTSVTHTYDAAGNLQTDGLHQYHYDSQGRLQSSQTGQGPDAPTTRYAHNALGQRVFKTEPLFAAASSKDGALDDEEEDPSLLQTLVDFFTRLWNPAKSDAEHLGWAYLYDEDGSLLGEYGMGGAQSAGQSQYIYLPTAQGPIPMAAEIDNRLYAIHTDHLGTPRRLTQADGQAAWQWAYTPYGDETPTLGAKRFTNETTNPTTGSTNIAPVRFNLRYPGQYFDEESGLHYNYFRSYDPRTGRYTQSDPIGLDGGWNRFAYVGGNPLGMTDPMGLQTVAPTPWGPMPLPLPLPVPGGGSAAAQGGDPVDGPPNGGGTIIWPPGYGPNREPVQCRIDIPPPPPIIPPKPDCEQQLKSCMAIARASKSIFMSGACFMGYLICKKVFQ
jgi:RHS repeat-associated protein